MECVKYQPKHISESSVATTFMTFLLTSERTNDLLPQNQKARPKPVGRAEVESVESCENKYLYNTNNLYCIYFWQHDILSVHGFLLTLGKERQMAIFLWMQSVHYNSNPGMPIFRRDQIQNWRLKTSILITSTDGWITLEKNFEHQAS